MALNHGLLHVFADDPPLTGPMCFDQQHELLVLQCAPEHFFLFVVGLLLGFIGAYRILGRTLLIN